MLDYNDALKNLNRYVSTSYAQDILDFMCESEVDSVTFHTWKYVPGIGHVTTKVITVTHLESDNNYFKVKVTPLVY